MKTFSPDREAHIPVLDGVRGLAILMVLFWHFWQGLAVYSEHNITLPKFFNVWGEYESIGQKGVDLFFVLSGFLITGILLRTKQSSNYFRNFYIRRALRIFPLYYFVVFICLAGGGLFAIPQYDWHTCWWYPFYIQNIGITFWPKSVGSPEHFWTLAVEEQFYLFWPLMVFLLSRRKLLFLSGTMLLAAFLFRFYFLFNKAGEGDFYFTLCRMDTLAFGAMLAVMFSDRNVWQRVVFWNRRLCIPFFLLASAVFIASKYHLGPLVKDLDYTVFAVLFGIIIVLAMAPGTPNPAPMLFQSSWLRWVGKISYGVYVFHPFVFHKISGIFYFKHWSPFQGALWPSLIAELILSIGLALFIAWISWTLFEKRLLKLKDRFAYEDRG